MGADSARPAYQMSYQAMNGQLVTVKPPRIATGAWFNGFVRIKNCIRQHKLMRFCTLQHLRRTLSLRLGLKLQCHILVLFMLICM